MTSLALQRPVAVDLMPQEDLVLLAGLALNQKGRHRRPPRPRHTCPPCPRHTCLLAVEALQLPPHPPEESLLEALLRDRRAVLIRAKYY